jgi:hypothetical protein
MFEVPNLDDLSTDAADYNEAFKVFALLAQYAALKHCAMLARQGGNVAGALENEKTTQTVYGALPEWARW